MYSKSSGSTETSAWVYWAWLIWLGGVVWVIRQTLTGVLDGASSYWLMLGLAVVAGCLAAPLLSRPRIVHVLILAPVWLFGAWYAFLSLRLPFLLGLLAPLFAYTVGMLLGAGVEMIQERIARRRRA